MISSSTEVYHGQTLFSKTPKYAVPEIELPPHTTFTSAVCDERYKTVDVQEVLRVYEYFFGIGVKL